MKRKASESPLVQRLRHHVTGAIERGEAQVIAGIPAIAPETFPVRMLQTIRHAGNVSGFVWLEGETYSATIATNQPEANRVFISAPTGEEISATLGEDCVRVAPETAETQIAARICTYVLQTRRFGHCYVHADIRHAVSGWKGATFDGIQFTFCGWGRSLQSARGHKYKAHANFVATGKPVPTKTLRSLSFA